MKLPLALLFGFFLAASSGAAERIDLFDTQGRRTGYAIVDRQKGRVDFYDVNSRRTGWGRVDAPGRVERFDLSGRRQNGTAMPKLWDLQK